MIKMNYILASVMGAVVIAGGVVGVASAATGSSRTGDIGTSGIPRTIYETDKLDAVAQVLNTSTANITAAAKDKSLKQLISSADLTKKTFRADVKADLTTDLKNSGYSQDQITIAFQHREIVRFHHHK
jgi:hypothetical protein